MRNLLIVISAPSGTGKTTVCRKLLELTDLVYSISYTTRPPREGEVNHYDYHFVTEDEFKRLIKKNEFIEWAKVYGHLYGTHKDFVLRNLKKKDVLLDVDVQGALALKKKFPENSILIYLLPPSIMELKKRLFKRQKGDQMTMKERLKTAKSEFKNAKFYDYILINEKLDETVNTIASIIDAEKHKGKSMLEYLKGMIRRWRKRKTKKN